MFARSQLVKSNFVVQLDFSGISHTQDQPVNLLLSLSFPVARKQVFSTRKSFYHSKKNCFGVNNKSRPFSENKFNYILFFAGYSLLILKDRSNFLCFRQNQFMKVLCGGTTLHNGFPFNTTRTWLCISNRYNNWFWKNILINFDPVGTHSAGCLRMVKINFFVLR